jgi:peptidoglycan/LPS O-acetylase OafA/YrhL
MIDFLAGAVTLGYIVAAAFFLRFWRKTAERLFLAFAAAFALFALNQALAYAFTVIVEPASLVYALRVLGFLIIIVAVVDKNLQKPLERSQRRVR